ncbi:MAG: T9SS type A sorting domain-containing protein [Calditrichia bacterium]
MFRIAICLKIVFLIFLTGLLFAQGNAKKELPHKSHFQTAIDTMDVNNIELAVDNAGALAFYNAGDYPAGSGQTFLFVGGLGLTGYVGDSLRTAWTARASLLDEFKPGHMANNPLDSLEGVYAVTASDTFGSANYIAWSMAVLAGAEFQDLNNDGRYNPNVDRPDLIGDKTLWTVYNDVTSLAQRTPRLLTNPLNVEIHQSLWGYGGSGSESDILFCRYRIINKGVSAIEEAIFTFTADPDIGDFEDDLLGCDVSRQMAYAFNNGNDLVYGDKPPAFGIVLLQGPITPSPGEVAYRYQGEFFGYDTISNARNQPIQSFLEFIGGDPLLPDPYKSQVVRNYGEGCLDAHGMSIDPTYWGTGGTSASDCRFLYPGDPVTATGWLANAPGDKRMLLSTDWFNMAKGDTQDVIMAYVVAQGADPLDAITEIRQRADLAKAFIGFENTPVGISPVSESLAGRFTLAQNYPNPFNPSTAIHFSLQKTGSVKLTVFDLLGQSVATLVDSRKQVGDHAISFDASNLAGGIYFYRLTVGSESLTRKMILLK